MIRARAGNLRASRDLVVGMGDDCAVLRPRRGEDLVMTTDLLLENVHFRRKWHPPQSVGHRALARGLSDLAAMGARPVAAYLSMALPAELVGRWLDQFLDGWFCLAAEHDVPLAGGDTSEAPRSGRKPGLAMADVVLVGAVPSGRALLRSGALSGDLLYVSGKLGGSAAELRVLRQRRAQAPAPNSRATRSHPQLFPQPRLAVGRKLIERHIATAAIDISDGLSTDLHHLCEASGLGAIVDRDAIPLAPGATLMDAVSGGEDYELLFTTRRKSRLRSVGGVPVCLIGRMTPKPGIIELRSHDGSRSLMPPRGWEHFGRPQR